MHRIKTIAACAIVALGVGATSATAKALITSGDIKNGTIKTEDLSASAKQALKGNAGARRRVPPVPRALRACRAWPVAKAPPAASTRPR